MGAVDATFGQSVDADPVAPDWSAVALPPGWPDALQMSRPRDFLRLAASVWRGAGAVELPAGLPVRSVLPAYLLQEFHRLPNGNYSLKLTHAYSHAFDVTMLGRMRRVRGEMAGLVARHGARCAIDLGCGSGRLAAALAKGGIPEVWGLDASPYLLRVGARNHPDVRFLQGLVEDTGFAGGRFDAAGACFLFHELPAAVAGRALAETARILKPGGLLVIGEPAPEQLYEKSVVRLMRRGGFFSLYFRALARFVHEPFVHEWHSIEIRPWLAAAGFELVEDRTALPFRVIVARKA